MKALIQTCLANELFVVFLISVLGYLLGRIKLRGLSLGTSGVLLIALLFGHFGYKVPGILRNMGLVIFVTSVGLLAGLEFFENFKRRALSYVVLGVSIVLSGFIVVCIVIQLFNVPVGLAAGLFTGALTSTPGLAAATEHYGDIAATGYGIAYPFGVIGVVLFVQIVPKFVKNKNISKNIILVNDEKTDELHGTKGINIDKIGFFSMGLAILFGVLIANIVIPLPGGIEFSLGISGGPLLAGLIIGNRKKIGNIRLSISEEALECMREFGLMMFLIGAGTQAGVGFLDILQKEGMRLFLFGVLITIIPMIAGYFCSKVLFHLDVYCSMGAITGGMTSTPALGALVASNPPCNVASAYAATYPAALVMVVILVQVISIIWGTP